MFALPKWLTDIKKLFATADGKVLGRVGGAWEFQSKSDSDHNHDSDYATKDSEHDHENLSTLDKIGEAEGLPTWDSGEWPGGPGGGGGDSGPGVLIFNYTHLQGGL